MNVIKKHLGKTIYINEVGRELRRFIVVSVKNKYFGICESLEYAEKYPHLIHYFNKKNNNESKNKWSELNGNFYESVDDYENEIKRRRNVIFIRENYMSFEQTEKIINMLENDK